MDGESEVFGFNAKVFYTLTRNFIITGLTVLRLFQLLCDGVIELCFEQVMAKARFNIRETVPLIKHLNTSVIELPLEAFVMRRYAKNLMIKNNEENLEFACGDPFISAELYIICEVYRREVSNLQQEFVFYCSEESFKRRRTLYFEKPPLVSDSEGEEFEDCKSPSVSPDQCHSPAIQSSNRIETIPEGEEMEKEEEDGGDGEFRPASRLRRNDRHLIDVSNYLLEQSILIGSNENVGTNKLEESLAATQFFSPGQMRQLLGPMLKVDEKVEEATVDPWCSQFASAFWIKVAPRMHTWSNYFPVESVSPPKTTFQFGSQYYHVEQRLDSGTYGTVYLARLLPPMTDENSPPVGGLMDVVTEGCFPEHQHLTRKSAFGEGILRVVKMESPDSPLEFYYMREARKRVASAFNSKKILIDVRSSICPALALTHSIGHFTSILMPYFSVGLLKFLNYGLELNSQLTATAKRRSTKSRSTKSRSRSLTFSNAPLTLTQKEEELVSLYLTLELLWIAEGLHRHARMIHGDIKPDNFRINDKFPMIDTSALDDDDENFAELEGRVCSKLPFIIR
ncbi:unnamed protein product [Hymenolepis diminuta]|uniref:Protein kinase domain-containing protein n=1 Tax=Hymenolepis diminuta TaxID=6216 RepID=A0A158QED4_HYMDI|nr:unnamed protein product [Hymenolepis diminuta]